MKRFYFLKRNPKIIFSMDLPTFRSTPDIEVGMPVSRANFCFAAVMPNALFQEKLKPNFPI